MMEHLYVLENITKKERKKIKGPFPRESMYRDRYNLVLSCLISFVQTEHKYVSADCLQILKKKTENKRHLVVFVSGGSSLRHLPDISVFRPQSSGITGLSTCDIFSIVFFFRTC